MHGALTSVYHMEWPVEDTSSRPCLQCTQNVVADPEPPGVGSFVKIGYTIQILQESGLDTLIEQHVSFISKSIMKIVQGVALVEQMRGDAVGQEAGCQGVPWFEQYI